MFLVLHFCVTLKDNRYYFRDFKNIYRNVKTIFQSYAKCRDQNIFNLKIMGLANHCPEQWLRKSKVACLHWFQQHFDF